jgi:hypothetical protein
MTVESSTEHGTTLRAVLFESDAAAVASIAEAGRSSRTTWPGSSVPGGVGTGNSETPPGSR